MYLYKFSFLLFGAMCSFFTGRAQCDEPYIYTSYDTVCYGDALYGYTVDGTYEDTLYGEDGCDTIRILYLTVAPAYDEMPSSSFFNTGTNGAGGILPGGSDDLNWEVATDIDGPYSPAIVFEDPPSSYSASSWPDCTWISHSAYGDHTGSVDYYYKIEFDLPCTDSCGNSIEEDSTFCLSLDFLADNSVYEVYVNGEPQSDHIPSIPVSDPYYHVGYDMSNMVTADLCYDWKPTGNTIIIHIKSGSPYAGFLAQFSTATPIHADPHADFYTSSIDGTEIPYNSGCAPFEVRFVNTSMGAEHYVWDFGDGTSPSTDLDPAHVYPEPGTYEVRLIAQVGFCAPDDTVTQQINVYPVYHDTIYQAICEGAGYLWLGEFVSTPGVYTKVLETAHGCDSILVLQLEVHPVPVIETCADTVLQGIQPLQLWATGGKYYHWEPSIWLSDDRVPDPVATPRHPIVYSVTVANEYGCLDSSFVRIGFSDNMMVPNAFSPNGDGLNDEFRIVNYGYQEILDFSIYNRWGEKIFITYDGSEGWDGTYKGQPSETGVYYYRIQARLWNNETKTIKGDLTLIR